MIYRIQLFINRHTVLILLLLAIIVRLPLIHTEFFRTPDAFEYLNVAENIISGNGFTQSIKRDFFSHDPVITSALKGRPLVTSFIFAFILGIFHSIDILQASMLFLGAINVVLFFLLARKFLTASNAFLASLLLLINPNFLITNRLLLSEPIFLCFTLLFFLVFFSKINSRNAFFLGVLAALAFLTRFEGILLLCITIFFLRQKWKQTYGLILCGFFLLTLPYFFGNALVNHNPLYSYNIYHLQVHHFSEGMWDGFGKTFPTKETFISHNVLWIIQADIRIITGNFFSIISFSFLGLLSIVYLFQIPHIIKKFAPFLLFSMFFFFILSVVWSAFQEPERHFTIIFPFLLIPVFFVFEKPVWKQIAKILIGITFFIYIVISAHRLYWARFVEPSLDNFGLSNKQQVYEWVRNHTKKQDILAATDPWSTYWFTKRPAVMLPKNQQVLNAFVKEYHVSYIISDNLLSKSNNTLVFSTPYVYVYHTK